MITYRTLSEAWINELRYVQNYGEESSPRGMRTLEQRWRQFAVTDPLTFPMKIVGRDFRNAVAILEATSLVGQFSVPELFTDRVKKFAEFTDAGVFHGSYGARVAGRLGDLVELLEHDPDTRQAVLTIYDSRSDLGAAKRDIPCTLSLHFMRHGDTLQVRATMRSNDLWLGTPYDMVQFAVLQASIAQALGLVPGLYVHSAGSLHLYERDLGEAMLVKQIRWPEDPPMSFPLWACASDIGKISERARRLALRSPGFDPGTEFESWALRVLY